MKIAVMAAGAVGGYFGGRLAAAGEDVAFVARGAQLEALRANGLAVASALGDLSLRPVRATADPAEIGPVDVVLLAVKLWATEAAGEACRALIGDDTAVIPLQNGVDSIARLTPILGAEHVVGGVAYISAVISAPGKIHHNGDFARLVFGEAGGGTSSRLEAFGAACAQAGIDHTLSGDIVRAQWEKFVFLAGLAGATGLTRVPLGRILDDPDCRSLFRNLMNEVVAVGRAAGVALDADFAADRMAFSETLPATMKASLLEDLERGNRLELDWLSGEVVRRGRELGVATPANATAYAALKLHAGGG